jgi:hypothetical protein
MRALASANDPKQTLMGDNQRVLFAAVEQSCCEMT